MRAHAITSSKPKGKRKSPTTAPPQREPAPPSLILHAHQAEAMKAFDAGLRNQYHAWHRRAGKDWFGMHLASTQMRTAVGTYWHLLPKHIQAKRAIWNGIDHVSGVRFIEQFFPDAVNLNNTEMLIENEAGSTWQLLGSDNYDRMIGSNPRGVVFSEWALCDPRAWDYIRPILRANKGWAIFISTFRGRNHAWQMYNNLLTQPDYFVTLKTIDDTGIISAADVEADRATGMSERLIQQEYYCKPAPPNSLGPYARVFDSLEQFGNVRDLPDSALVGAVTSLAVGASGRYTALLQCVARGGNYYLSGGRIDENAALHEVLAGYTRAIAAGDVQLTASEEVTDEITYGLKLPRTRSRKASQVETAGFLERSILSPTSVIAATLTGGLGVLLDEEGDEEEATEAIYDALERLAGSAAAQGSVWGPKPDYSLQDRAIIGRMQ